MKYSQLRVIRLIPVKNVILVMSEINIVVFGILAFILTKMHLHTSELLDKVSADPYIAVNYLYTALISMRSVGVDSYQTENIGATDQQLHISSYDYLIC